VTRHLLTAIISFGAVLAGNAATANAADHGRRSQVAGIDLITYRTDVRDVVVILGSLPAGDSLASISLPALDYSGCRCR